MNDFYKKFPKFFAKKNSYKKYFFFENFFAEKLFFQKMFFPKKKFKIFENCSLKTIN